MVTPTEALYDFLFKLADEISNLSDGEREALNRMLKRRDSNYRVLRGSSIIIDGLRYKTKETKWLRTEREKIPQYEDSGYPT